MAAAREFTIEKKVPIPPRKSGRPRESKYPLVKLRIGDSFLVPVGQFTRPQYVVTMVHALAKKIGIKVSTRSGAEGVRVWRTT